MYSRGSGGYRIRLQILRHFIARFPNGTRDVDRHQERQPADEQHDQREDGRAHAARPLRHQPEHQRADPRRAAIADLVKAEELFNSMTAQTPESKWGLGVIAITKGEYDKAVNLFGTEPCFNLALAQLLKGDLNRAKATLDSMKESCQGRAPYLKAVIGARTDDKNAVLTGLREAAAIDPAWKAAAKTDMEFAKFFADDAFKTVVQ